MSFVSLLSAESNDVEFDNENHPNESSINLDPFIQQMSYDNTDITVMNNRQLKAMFNFNTNSQTTNTIIRFYRKRIDNSSLNRHLSWMRWSSIKFRKNY
ncbi:hypothetical protein RO3G_05182 [Rhizopus delemar RA 99-880]|uniref:Uncharacterized protein n=1 Tax=Rhizopus delemar (strain RA 99-880 / ATCC MYA-4621 / FGSC 9543 / NRRL 43880) TaxID=246409 RepID=I1BW97_RHIO9|nr:hypothetical protein RO3G_05182 [Rhizopus delemar RA 99-880]|eukprot:EIE80477.1 hypothetical protein RO3G_05182 [Rhizopus delemar RA 99-880]